MQALIRRRNGSAEAPAEQENLWALAADVTAALARESDLRAALHHCSEALVQHLDAAFARIWTLNSAENVLELQASAGVYTHLNGPHSRVPLGALKIGRIAEERRPHLTNSVVGDPRVSDQEWAKQEGMVAFAGYPLVVGDRVVGVMAAFARKSLSEQTLAAMSAVANGIAVGIERIRSEESLRSSEERFRRLFEEAPVAYHEIDNAGVVRRANRTECELLGYQPSELLGRNIWEFVALEQQETSRQTVKEKLCGQRPLEIIQRDYVRRDGVRLTLEIHEKFIQDDAGAVVGIRSALLDITERRRMEEALRESEERYSLAARGANDGIWDWNLKTNEVYYSPRWKSMLGFDENEIGTGQDEWFGRVHPDDVGPLRMEVARHLEGEAPHVENEHRVLCKDGSYVWVLCRGLAVRNEDRHVTRVAGSLSDVTKRKAAEKQLLHNAFHDPLTGLPNRTLFMDRLEHALAGAKRHKGLIAVLFLDLDRFKLLNDSLGHATGDRLLIAIAQRLGTCVRREDTVSRLGGDEFAILLEDAEEDQASRVAERIQRELALPFKLGRHEVFTTTSIGIALSTSASSNRPQDLLRDADTAMYRAKSLGKAGHAVFDQEMHARAVAMLQLENDLRRALDREEFWIQYQPIVSLVTGAVTALEALIRWQHPQRGLVPPADFIPLAEESGLIDPLGQWVLRKVCRQIRLWQDEFPAGLPWTVSVNISARQLKRRSFIQQIDQVLKETGVDAGCLTLEITEGAILEADSVIEGIRELKARKFKVHIDDFGTGYSSLDRLRTLAADALKIDRSFIQELSAGPNREFARVIVALAQNLGMDVIAEGIETAEQLAEIRALGCGYGQGYLFARPMDPDAARLMKCGCQFKKAAIKALEANGAVVGPALSSRRSTSAGSNYRHRK